MALSKKVKEAKGSINVTRQLDEPEPNIIKFAPEPPEGLSKNAIKVWTDIVPKLVSLQIFSEIDTTALIFYCNEVAMYHEACKKLEQNGFVFISGTSGYEMPSAWVAIRNKSLSNVLAFSKEFGLSPAARTKISVSKSQPVGKRASIIKKANG